MSLSGVLSAKSFQKNKNTQNRQNSSASSDLKKEMKNFEQREKVLIPEREEGDLLFEMLHEVLKSRERAGFRDTNYVYDFEGRFRSDYIWSKNATLLNNSIPDEYSYFQNRLDLTFSAVYQGNSHVQPLIECGGKIRTNHIAGDFGALSPLSDARVTHGGVVSEQSHTHTLTFPTIWPKYLYCKIDLPALFRKPDLSAMLTVGLFNFSLGRGIAYGKYYGKNKEFLGLFNTTNEYAPFGASLSGRIFKGKLWYDLYWARLQEFSDSFSSVFNQARSHIDRENPFIGKGKVNDVLAFRLRSNLKLSEGARVEMEQYGLYNTAKMQEVEMPYDSASTLFTFGSTFEYRYKDIEIGGEYASNFGYEEVFALDRNTVTLAPTLVDGGPVYTPQYSHVYYAQSGYKVSDTGTSSNALWHGKKVFKTPAVDTLVTNDTSGESGYLLGSLTERHLIRSGETPSIAPVSYDIYNSETRYRPYYKNTYKGFVGVIDGTYHWRALHLSLSASCGIASGDADPHSVEENKVYKGFIGLNENYAGGRVPSVFVLNARKGARPLSSNSINDRSLLDTSFSDLIYSGAGIAWHDAASRLHVRGNVIHFWKYSPQEISTDVYADSHLGFELNALATYKLSHGLFIAAQAGLFNPGQYYDDLKGLALNSSAYQKLSQGNDSGYVAQAYALGNSVGYFATIGMRFVF